jgi:two-component system sensor histidine kinase BarA
MIVDDDPLMRSALARSAKHAFQDVVLEIVMAESGADALARAIEVPPDLVTLDVDMPGIDGVATLAALRGTVGAAHVPALVITGHPLDDVRWRFAALGVADFLEKPVSVEKIAPALRRALRLSIH